MAGTYLLLAEVCTTLFYSDANICVVKITAIQFKELNQKDSQIVFECPTFSSRVMLYKIKMEKCSNETENTLLILISDKIHNLAPPPAGISTFSMSHLHVMHTTLPPN